MSSEPRRPARERGPSLGRRRLLTLAAAMTAAGVPPLFQPAHARPRAGTATVHWTSESTAPGYAPGDGRWYEDPATGLEQVAHRLSPQEPVPVTDPGEAHGQLITVEPSARRQTVLGIGSSTEESTVHNLSRMSPSARSAVLRALYHPTEGAGFNLTRICFGTSDFTAEEFYTYADEPDPELSRFSIQRDIDLDIVATLREALSLNPALKVTATPWSAPPWMKDSGTLVGGALLDEHVPTFARYHRLAVQAYQEQGIPLHAVTPQNEPGFVPEDYPGMKVTPDQERRLIEAMRREFDAHGLDTRIWCFDWNFAPAAEHLATTLGVPGAYTDAYRASQAIALHDYEGEPADMSALRRTYPDLDVLLNERMVWGTEGADRIAQYFRHDATAYQAWVTMLDRNIAPEQWTGVPDPTPLVQDPDHPDTYWALPEYHLIAQYSRFVGRGSVRVESDAGDANTLTNVAFAGPDQTLTVVVINQTGRDREFTLRTPRQQLSHTLPAKTVGTYVWRS
ncbi:glycoside hydrolase family 30 beta sandwich domain-containing protein [Streptomyces sp. NPDC005438]|uniref:glycoside hydrolase family 30 protein n=1 Tax=Streptomyces sp. NPDC005438 TaxID=3156880 RepID=UPI0033AE29B6